MCGIAFALLADPGETVRPNIEAMTRIVEHRGPDGEGLEFLGPDPGGGWRTMAADSPWHVAMGHRRLAILDLSPAGRQPMARGRDFWITFNGEIYNYVELRAELEGLGHAFTTATDTEVILAAWAQWGTVCFRRFRGMWAMVIVDTARGVVVFSRDRLGIKPLYISRAGGVLLAASEIKQIAAAGVGRALVDLDAVRQYLATGWESIERTMFRDVSPLLPGTWLSCCLQSGAERERGTYWNPEGIEETVSSPSRATEILDAALSESVRIHLRSDVPVGVALSGGVDSTLLAAVAREVSRPGVGAVHMFSSVFPGSSIDEGPAASNVAARLQGQWHSVEPKPEEFLSQFDRFTWHHDEPVGSAAQYAAFRVAEKTRELGVPVSLNGQGGDELLCGYWQSYFANLLRSLRLGRIGIVADAILGSLLPGGNGEIWRQAPVMLRRYLARRRELALLGEGAKWGVPEGLGRPDRVEPGQRRLVEMRQLFLPRLLKWDDRNFMAFGVEGRYPYLDHVVIESALTFRPEALCRRGWTKEPARRLLERKLGPEVARSRRKLGFETPQASWLRGPMRRVLDEFMASSSPVWEIVGGMPVRRRVRASLASSAGRGEEDDFLFRLFAADRWLRVFALEVP